MSSRRKKRGSDAGGKEAHFVRLYDSFVDDVVIRGLSAMAFRFLVRLCLSWRGGDVCHLTAPVSCFAESWHTVARARQELVEKGVIEILEPGGLYATRQGGQRRCPATYRLTPRYLELAAFGMKNRHVLVNLKMHQKMRRQLGVEEKPMAESATVGASTDR